MNHITSHTTDVSSKAIDGETQLLLYSYDEDMKFWINSRLYKIKHSTFAHSNFSNEPPNHFSLPKSSVLKGLLYKKNMEKPHKPASLYGWCKIQKKLLENLKKFNPTSNLN